MATRRGGGGGTTVLAAALPLFIAAIAVAAAAAPAPLRAQEARAVAAAAAVTAAATHRSSLDAVAVSPGTAFSRTAGAATTADDDPPPPPPAPDDEPFDEALRIGIRAGAYFPNDAKVREVFRDVIPALGLATVTPVHPNHARFFPALELFGMRSGKNHFFIVPLTLVGEYQLPAGSGRRNNVPYLRGEAGVAYFDYRVARAGTVVRSRRGGGAASVDAGVLVSRSFRVGARYRILQHFDGYDFGGVELYTVIGSFHIL